MNQTTSDRLIEFLTRAGRACSPSEAAKASGISNASELYQLANALEEEGKLIVTRQGNLVLPEHAGLHRAVIVSQSPRFSFAKLEESGEDVYLDANDGNGAILGDTVWVGSVKRRPKGLSGEVVRVVAKGSHLFTGKLVRGKQHRAFEFVCDAAFRYPLPVRISKKETAPKPGSKIMAEVRMAKDGELYAQIRTVYGSADCARICANSILDANQIPTQFPPEVLAEAEAFSGEIPETEWKVRLDLREEKIFTIDGADAKDLDDAISVKKTESGWNLGVHIADVSHYVRPGSALDREAFRRATSVYFADRVVPMLPEAISNGVCSLTAGTDKLAFSALMKLDDNGDLVHFAFRKTVIRSKVRGVYGEVNRIFDGSADAEILEKYAPVRESLNEARKLAVVLRRKAAQRGNLELESRESRFILDENGICIAMAPRQTGEAEQLIEQLMITANQAAAKLARQEKLPFVYRVHEDPSPERLETLREQAAQMGLPVQEILPGVSPVQLAQLLRKASETKFSRIFSNQLLRTMAKAKYDTRPIGHYGLGLEDYCHFTSPIRRYPDTSIHRILSEFASGVEMDVLNRKYGNFVTESARQSSFCEVRAMNAERETERCYAAELMRSHIGETFRGVVASAAEWGIYVELENSAEGLIRAEYLPHGMEFDGFFSFCARRRRDKISVGDPVLVRIVHADVSAGQIDLGLEDYGLEE